MIRLLTMCGFACVVATIGDAATQPSPDDQRRAAITLMRAINTAEAAVRSKSGKYVHLTELLEIPAMGRVKPDIAIKGSTATYQGMTIRLALSTDAAQYQVAVVPGETCGWAAFGDERGLIYTGKVLDC
jgi:hypothetical protein